MQRAVIIILALFLSSVVVGVGTVFYLFNSPASLEKQEVIFEVMPGPLAATARRLESEGFIRSQLQFRLVARLMGSQARVGEYLISPHMTPAEILKIISSGKSLQKSITIPEGSNIFEIALQLESLNLARREEFLSLCFNARFLNRHLGDLFRETNTCEGFLFPETYAYTKYTTLEELISQMISMFKEKFGNIGPRGRQFGLSPQQVVVLASIIEKETGAPDEVRLVSSVYHNRLSKKMRLQADPTTLYGKMMVSKKLETNIRREDLKSANPYNTYSIFGLPVGPIANPGLRALQAAVNPEVSEYLYFVSQNDGRHVFSKDFKNHDAAVKAFQKNPAARRGKSWRDLKAPKAQVKSP